jgi:SAM-dependent methyltransferase
MIQPKCLPSATAIPLLFATLLAAATGAFAESSTLEEPALGPGFNSHYMDPDVERWRHVFESPGREIFDQRQGIVQATGVRPGMAVADIGAGTGLFAILFARAVGPAGKVYAVDISPGFVEAIEKRAADYRLANLTPVVNDPKQTGLPPGSVDLIFLCDTYHHFEYPGAMLDSISNALRQGGELVVIDFRREPGVSSPWVMSHVRANQAEVVAEIQAAGFELVETQDFLRENYYLRFRKQGEE